MKKMLLVLLAASVLITFAIFLPYSLRILHSLPNAVDPVFYAWNLAHNTESAFNGFKDLLDTNIFYPEGNTLAFSDSLFAQTLFTAPIIILTKNPVLAENLYVFTTFPLAAAAMFFLTYYLTGNALASAIAGLFYAFSSPRLSQIGHMPALSSQWLPLVFLYLIKFIREGTFKNLFFLFLWYALSIASSIYFGVFLIPMAVITVITEIVKQSRTLILSRIKLALVWALPAVIILIVLLFPYIRLKAENPTIKRPITDTVSYSAAPSDYVSVLPTSWLGDLGFPVQTNEHPLYPTVTVLVLALVSIFFTTKHERKMAVSFLSIAVVAFFLSLGPFWNSTSVRMPYYYLYQVFPLLESVRVPARFSIFVMLGLSAAASFSLAHIVKNVRSRPLVAVLLLVFLTEVWQIGTPSVAIPLQHTLPPVYNFLTTVPEDSIIVELPLRLESEGLTMSDQLMRLYPQVTEVDTFALEAYRTYFSVFHRKRMLNGYSGFFPNVYHDHIATLASFPSDESLKMLNNAGVRYILLHGEQYTSVRFSDVDRYVRETPELVKIAQFESDYVYELKETDK